ncbi:MAG: hypothetical protein FJ267_13315 [Planctomycetes bacterium]|nr:hypothetical protein [Planctomycetota bacterium]
MGSAKSYLGLGPGWSTVANTPFRKHKHWTHEGGITTPLIVSWKQGIAARGEIRTAPGHLVDFLPTAIELAGMDFPASWNDQTRPSLPGRSLVETFQADVNKPREPLFFKHQGNRALRHGDWKIVAAGPESAWELYDLAKDRSETQNLASTLPDKVQELTTVWSQLDTEYARQGATGMPLRRNK